MFQMLVLLVVTQSSEVLAVDAGVPARPDVAAAVSPDVSEPAVEDDIERMRALEASVVDKEARTDAAFRAAVAQLPLATGVRDRLEFALLDGTWNGEVADFVLPPVLDIATFDVASVKGQYDIPVEMQPLVQEYIQFFLNGGRKWFKRWMSRSTRFMPLMQPILEAKGLPRDTVYLSMIESGFNTQAKSWAKAVGPWQFIAGTAKMYALKEDFWVDERRDPVKSTHAAAGFLTRLYRESGTWYLAWAGYNSGGGRVKRVINLHQTDDFWALSNKTPGFAKETKHYVPKLIACALVAKHWAAFGFSRDEFDFQPPFEFDEVSLTDSFDLEVLATAAGTTADVIAELNPELKRLATPPASAEKPYNVRIPRGQRDYFAAHFEEAAASEKLNYKAHVVAAGDTLSSIARRYQSAPEAILRVNQMLSLKRLKVGSELVVPTSKGALASAQAVEKQVVRARRSGVVAPRADEQVPAGASSAPSMPQGSQVEYVVAKGDSLWSIARRYDVHVTDLRAWNPVLADSRGLKVGLTLTLVAGAKAATSSAERPATTPSALTPPALTPPSASAPPSQVPVVAQAVPGQHTVESGDSLWSLSQRYHCSVENLKAWNNLASAKLKLGQKLVVAAR
jgi:membrane-bound lytic murein transglycosylase D